MRFNITARIKQYNNIRTSRKCSKTLNHPDLINYELIKDSTTSANPICIVDRPGYKHVIIDSSIFDKAAICGIDLPDNIDDDVMEFSPDTFCEISGIIDWVRSVFVMPWGSNRTETIVTYTYPTM